jgi:glycosyltransferase involved in cell wall biosynthesis
MELKETIGDDCPIVTINHMTPFHDKYDGPYVVDFIKKMTKGTLMITNSRTAAKQWGWGTPVIHGMDVDEWWDLPKEPRVTTVLSPAGMEKAYRRVFLREVIKKLKEAEVPFVWIGVDRKFNSFDEYRNFLGRSLIFFFPAWQSPMSRARTEAMLSGACIVTTPYQDADTFIEHGVNGFLTSKYTMKDPRIMDNPDATAKLIKRLVLDEPELAIKVGQEGRKTARKLFCRENFTKQWIEIVKKLGIEGM